MMQGAIKLQFEDDRAIGHMNKLHRPTSSNRPGQRL
jgi:hypothetical protein